MLEQTIAATTHVLYACRVVHLGRLAIAVGLVGCVACGLAFAPGDFAESAPGLAGPDSATGTPDAGDPGEGGALDADGPLTRIVVFAGRRDAVPGEASSSVGVAETMRTTVSASGELGPWAFDVSPPQTASWTRAVLSGDQLFLQSQSAFLTVTFAGAILGPEWRTLPTRSLPEGIMRPWLVSEDSIFVAGGQSDGAFTTNVFSAAIFPDGGVDEWRAASSKLVKARGDVTLVRHGDFLYAIGGRDSGSSDASGRDEVEVARFDADGDLGPFTVTTKLVNPAADAAAFQILAPTVTAGAGHLFVIGGQTTPSGGSMTDLVIAAKIDEATGELGPWKALPKLPAPMNGAAAVVAGERVLLFGGNLGEVASDAVLALSIAQNGSFGTEWKKVGSLPGPRAGLAALVY